MQGRGLRILAVGLLALALGGCVVSERPLFDPAAAVTPAQAGRYEQQELKGGRWTKQREGALQIEGRVYSWKPDNETEPASFSVFPAGKDRFMVYARIVESGKPEHYYALLRKDANELHDLAAGLRRFPQGAAARARAAQSGRRELLLQRSREGDYSATSPMRASSRRTSATCR